MRFAGLLLALGVVVPACGDEEPTARVEKGGPVEHSEQPRLNRLAKEKSPYLRQHATNPVDWFPWGDEAFAKARKEDKPVFLSIGYSSCHWCHVMEHESFADEEVAKVLNEHYVAVKVDREERPDVDDVYMTAAQLMMRGGGGWPLSVWLTPEGKPFVAGTYFPKESKWGRKGFLELLEEIAGKWNDPQWRERIHTAGDQAADYLQQALDAEEPGPLPDGVLEDARHMVERFYDREAGGFAGPPAHEPKFPSPSTLEMLLRWSQRHPEDTDALGMVTNTLDRMGRGGIHDHVGGGFHRYSVTRNWLVPHFEKMLYDNAQLLGLYAWAHRATGKELYAETARDIALWVRREMTHPDGGFYSAQDADDPGGPEGEGGFYVWDPAEIAALFPDPGEAKALQAWFDVTDDGNWFVHGQHEKPGKSILQVTRTPEEAAKEAGLSVDDLRALLPRARARMYEVREKRPKPMTDTKVLAGWNGLMISGYCVAYQALGDEAFLEAAVKAGRFLRGNLMKDGRLRRRWAEGEAAFDAVLADYGAVIAPCLDRYESTLDREWLAEALRLEALATKLFFDPKDGGYFFTAADAEKLIARSKPGFDSAKPSGNGLMAMNLMRIAELTGAEGPRERAEKTLHYFGNRVSHSALGHGALLNACDFLRSGPREIFIAGERDDPATRALVQAVWRDPDRNRVLALAGPGIVDLLPPAEGKVPVDGKPAAYICRNFACDAPVTDPAALRSR